MTWMHTEMAELKVSHAADLRSSAEAASADREAATAQHLQQVVVSRGEHAAEIAAMQEASADQVRCRPNARPLDPLGPH